MSSIRIDWINQLIGFLGAVVGIFIAFQLSDWQERSREEEKVKIALAAIKSEIDDNMGIYKRDITLLSNWLEYWDFVGGNQPEFNGQLKATEKKMELMRKNHPKRLDSAKFIKKYKDSINIYSTGAIMIDVTVESGISTSSWEAAKSSGVLNSLDHTRMTQLTKIYDWINKDLGIDDADVIRRNADFESPGFSDVSNLTHDYGMITRVYDFKLDRIEKVYQKIDWEVE